MSYWFYSVSDYRDFLMNVSYAYLFFIVAYKERSCF